MEESVSALRVSQLDAAALDKEINDICISQWRKVTNYLPAYDFSRLEPEFEAAVKALFWFYIFRIDGATVGQQMMDMRYKTRPKLALGSRVKWTYFFLSVVLPWLRQRLPSIMGFRNDDRRIWTERMLDKCCTIFELVNVMHCLVFLNRGGFATILERILGLRAVHNTQPYLEQLDMAMTERELLWHGFSDLLIFFVPLINYRRLYNAISRIGRWSKGGQEGANERIDRIDTLSPCAYCRQTPPIAPCHFGCGHVHCYYCLAANLEADQNYSCSVCGYAKGDRSVVFCKR